ncbi:META domain-containing protein [Bosea sp. (in: a-proteobacteria)]|uniref:META domain-containing protein n=1 Tax=Bosea sp. (in: a-proteobacteria) TaxID=1871050 RepID=UPI00273460FF|nr:META domain-containing protein [Bosea sp. (in: a-proteobacteria)]MDP3407371.1 META domain-containing protein [Bosea sp. (in: a-proteobacteria)]
MVWTRRLGPFAGFLALVLSQGALAAPLGAPPYTARGQEPGWRLSITQDIIALEMASGERLQAPTPRARRNGGRARYDVVFEGRPARIAIERRLCRDTMSGMPHPDTVAILQRQPVLRGCGGEPRDLLTVGAWRITHVAGRRVLGKTRPTLEFLADGGLAGDGSCNRFRTSYTLTGEGLTLGPAAATMMACDPAVMAQEQVLLRRLEGVRSFDIRRDGALVLNGKDGAALVARRP